MAFRKRPRKKYLCGAGPFFKVMAGLHFYFSVINLFVVVQGTLRDLDLMSEVAKNNLCNLNDNEMNFIYAYLKTKSTQ
jgi:hypothetical protein